MRSKVSFVIPCYNQASLISNSINSVLHQTYDNWELVIIDDGSTDNLEEVVKRFQEKIGNRISYYKQEHKGMVEARNFGNTMATGEIILLQDADDLAMPDRAEKCVEALKDCDVVYHGLYTNIWDIRYQCICRFYIKAKPFNIDKLLEGQYIPGACAFWKRVWKEKQFRNETDGAFDWMMHLDWALSGYKYKPLDIGLYEYVRHSNSISIENENKGYRQRSIEKIKEIVKNEYSKTIS